MEIKYMENTISQLPSKDSHIFGLNVTETPNLDLYMSDSLAWT